MRSFKVYAHPTRGLEAVKDGFSWPAFFGGFPWLLFRKLWRHAALVGFVFVTAKATEASALQAADDWTKVFVSLAVSAVMFFLYILPAFLGNRWLGAELLRRGYEYVRTVECETAQGAVTIAQRFPGDRSRNVERFGRRFS